MFPEIAAAKCQKVLFRWWIWEEHAFVAKRHKVLSSFAGRHFHVPICTPSSHFRMFVWKQISKHDKSKRNFRPLKTVFNGLTSTWKPLRPSHLLPGTWSYQQQWRPAWFSTASSSRSVLTSGASPAQGPHTLKVSEPSTCCLKVTKSGNSQSSRISQRSLSVPLINRKNRFWGGHHV